MMNIGDITQGGLSGSEQLKRRPVEQATPVHPEAPDRHAQRNADKPSQDSVSISEAARLALEEDHLRQQELDAAKAALNGLPEMSEARKAAIQERLNSQYYQRPDVQQQIASNLSNELAPPSKE